MAAVNPHLRLLHSLASPLSLDTYVAFITQPLQTLLQ